MKSYVWLTFAFMGWGYYEMSGGAEFEPVEREVAQAEVIEPEIVTRAETPTLLAVSTSNVSTQPQETAVEVAQVVAQATALDAIEEEVVEIVAPVIEPELDIRAVKGSRVNMRMGPGTSFDVITTLDGGTKLEVLSVDAEGWANVSTERGIEGWMAERLLSDPET